MSNLLIWILVISHSCAPAIEERAGANLRLPVYTFRGRRASHLWLSRVRRASSRVGRLSLGRSMMDMGGETVGFVETLNVFRVPVEICKVLESTPVLAASVAVSPKSGHKGEGGTRVAGGRVVWRRASASARALAAILGQGASDETGLRCFTRRRRSKKVLISRRIRPHSPQYHPTWLPKMSIMSVPERPALIPLGVSPPPPLLPPPPTLTLTPTCPSAQRSARVE